MKKQLATYIIITIAVAILTLTACNNPTNNNDDDGGNTGYEYTKHIAYKCESTDGTGTYYVFMNGDTGEVTFDLSSTDDLTSADVVADGTQAGTAAIASPTGFTLSPDGKTLTLDAATSVIFRKN